MKANLVSARGDALHNNKLVRHARDTFGELSVAEYRCVHAAAFSSYAYCGPSHSLHDPEYDPVNADREWGRDRYIRAELIKWLCTDADALQRISPLGIQINGAKITGNLDLAFIKLPFPIGLFHCRLSSDTNFNLAQLPGLNLENSLIESLFADAARITGTLYLKSLIGKRVHLRGCKIGLDFNCGGAKLTADASSHEPALYADLADVGGDVFLGDEFCASGGVFLAGAKIGGDLSCGDGRFMNSQGPALDLNRALIGGEVFLTDGFCATGLVDVSEAQVGRSLFCSGGAFEAVTLEDVSIKGKLDWSRIRVSDMTRLKLTNASVRELTDDDRSWPKPGNLDLNGFEYLRLSTIWSSPDDVTARLKWIDRQKEFRPQPYIQLANVLQNMGNDEGSKRVRFALESRRRAESRRNILSAPVRWLDKSLDTISSETVGYGIYPRQAAWCLVGLATLGWIVFRRAQRLHAMVPKDKDACKEFREGRRPIADYPAFHPFVYSLETVVPFLKLGQADKWQPDPSPEELQQPDSNPERRERRRFTRFVIGLWSDKAAFSAWLRWFDWGMICLGWLLATFLVAGLTGIIK